MYGNPKITAIFSLKGSEEKEEKKKKKRRRLPVLHKHLKICPAWVINCLSNSLAMWYIVNEMLIVCYFALWVSVHWD